MNAFFLKQAGCLLGSVVVLGFFSPSSYASTIDHSPSATFNQSVDQPPVTLSQSPSPKDVTASESVDLSSSTTSLTEPVVHSSSSNQVNMPRSQTPIAGKETDTSDLQPLNSALASADNTQGSEAIDRTESTQPKLAATVNETAQTFAKDQTNAAIEPLPGHVSTQAAALQPEPPLGFTAADGSLLSQTEGTPAPGTAPGTAPAPADNKVTPGRSTRSGSSYFGVGGNFGVGDGDTAVGRTSFALYSKIGLLRYLSVRPALLIRSNVTVLLPVTYDFSFGEGPTENLGFRAAPFVGAGPAITTGGGGNVDLLLTGGIDIPLSSRFTATAAVNATVTGNPAVGIFIGVGYNFSGF